MALALFCIDPSLGRLDYDSLSDQTRMEILIDGLTNGTKKHFQDQHGGYKAIEKWRGVRIDKEANVISISFSPLFFVFEDSGSLNFAFLPPKLRAFSALNQKLRGTVDAENLPENLLRCTMSNNGLSGSFDLGKLPDQLESLNLRMNSFSGECDLSKLPKKMKWLILAKNAFSGSVRLDALPIGFEHLELQHNDFSGKIDLSKLPEALKYMNLHGNQFSGGFILRKLPEALLEVGASSNRLSGLAVVSSERRVRVGLGNTAIERVVDEKGEPHVHGDEMLSTITNLM